MRKFFILTISIITIIFIIVITSSTCFYINKTDYVINEISTILNKEMSSLKLSIEISDSVEQKSQIESIIKEIDKYYTYKINQTTVLYDSKITREMNHLNVWVTIWIGLIGCIGIFLPIIIQHMEWKKFNTESEKAISEIEKIRDEIIKEKPNIDKAINEEIPKKIKDELKSFIEKSKEIEFKLPIIVAISYLKELGNYPPYTFSEPEKIEAVKETLQNIKDCIGCIYHFFEEYKNQIDHFDNSYLFLVLYFELTAQQLHTISTKRNILQKIDLLLAQIEKLKKTIKSQRNKEDIVSGFNNVYVHLTDLIDEINKEYKNTEQSE